jgi:hypothetical protein
LVVYVLAEQSLVLVRGTFRYEGMVNKIEQVDNKRDCIVCVYAQLAHRQSVPVKHFGICDVEYLKIVSHRFLTEFVAGGTNDLVQFDVVSVFREVYFLVQQQTALD